MLYSQKEIDKSAFYNFQAHRLSLVSCCIHLGVQEETREQQAGFSP